MKRSVKVIVCIVLSVMLAITVFPVSASAITPAAGNATREARILYAMVDAANVSIAIAVRIAQITPYDDVDALLVTVDVIVAAVTAYADRIGAELACDYTEYVIDGRTVLIDPLRVVNIPGTGGGGGSGGGGGGGGGGN